MTVPVNHLHFQYLGGKQIQRYDGSQLKLRGIKEQGLLAYLVLESRQAHSRETIMGLFWPEMPQKQARNNLRVTLARLRKKLGNDQEGRSFLKSSRHEVAFNQRSDYWLDVSAFQSDIRQVHRHQHQGDTTCDECQAVMIRAADLYRGEFMAGFYVPGCPAFDEWLLVQREHLHIQAMELLDQLASLHTHAGDYKAAERFARRQIELDPLQESAHRQLMHACTMQGQRSAALNAFEKCRQVLLDELGVEPDHDTTLLHSRILAGESTKGREHRPMVGIPAILSSPEPAPTPHNLPENLTPFIGREHELEQMGRRLAEGDYRIITIVGPGGMGKSRLALQIASENLNTFPDGVYFVPLAAVQTVDVIPTAIADAIDITFANPEQPPQEQLLQALRSRKLLLVLDNMEHLLDSVDLLLDVIRQVPAVTLLLTSRERLDIQAEDLFHLRGLAVPGPDELEHAGRFAAIRLFADRAHRLRKSFKLIPENIEAIARICRMLDGTPLAIELAASWIRDYSCEELADAIARNLDLLAVTYRDLPPRHRSMRAIFDHSWHLLGTEQQTLLSRLSVFRGGFSAVAAEAITEATTVTLTNLSFKSLLQNTGSGRYDMHELIRQFAEERLESITPEQYLVLDKHCRYHLEMVAQHSQRLCGSSPFEASTELHQDIDNIRLAWARAVERGFVVELETCLPGMARYYSLNGLYQEGELVFTQTLVALLDLRSKFDPDNQSLTRLRSNLLIELAEYYTRRSKLNQAVAIAQDAVELAQGLGDKIIATRAYLAWGYALAQRGEYAEARHLLESALVTAREQDTGVMEGLILRHLGNTLIDLGEHQQGDFYLEQALEVFRRYNHRSEIQAVLLYQGVIHVERHDYEPGRRCLEQALAMIQETGDRSLESRIQNAVGYTNAALGQLAAALPFHEHSRAISYEIGDPYQESHALHNLCSVHRKLGDLEAAELDGIRALRLAIDNELADPEGYALLHLGYVWHEQTKSDMASDAFRRSADIWRQLDRLHLAAEATAGEAMHALAMQRVEQAQVLISPVLAFLGTSGVSGMDEPAQVYLTCYQVLAVGDDARAPTLLDAACQHIEQTASLISDPALRRSYLNLPAHRQIITLCRSLR